MARFRSGLATPGVLLPVSPRTRQLHERERPTVLQKHPGRCIQLRRTQQFWGLGHTNTSASVMSAAVIPGAGGPLIEAWRGARWAR
jgi:hypothetical protein